MGTTATKVIIAVMAIMLVLAIAVIGVLLFHKEAPSTKDVYETMEASTAKNNGTISIPGVTSMSWKANQTVQKSGLFNPAQNNCYFQISIYKNSPSGEATLLWQSELMKPGTKVTQIHLLETLDAGEYEAYIQYSCFTMDDSKTELNGSKIDFVLNVNK